MPVVLITGTSTGIGRALAFAFADRGDDVYATMRDVTKAGDLVDRENISVVGLDVTDDESVAQAVAEITKRAGRVDVVVNNAGIDVLGAFEDLSDEMGRQIMETNFWGAIRVTRACLPLMRAQNSGAIAMVTSVAAALTPPGEPFYAASKRALEAAAEGLRHEVSRWNIRVCVVEPGFVDTPITTKIDKSAASPPDSPYRELIAFMNDDQVASLGGAPPPEGVAAEICTAVYESDAFTIPVGEAAQKIVAWRARQEESEYFAKLPRNLEFGWWGEGKERPPVG